MGPETVSERRACRVLGQPRTTQRYQPQRPGDERKLLAEMRSISHRRPRYGSPRVHRTLQATGWYVNHKRIERIWREESRQVPRKQHRRRRLPNCGSENSCVRRRAQHKDHVWSYDFVTDRTEDRRQIRLLVVIDEFTRECLAIEVARSFTARQVVEVLRYLFAVRGTPQFIRSRPTPTQAAIVCPVGARRRPVAGVGTESTTGRRWFGPRARFRFCRPVPRTDLRGHRHIPGHLLIITDAHRHGAGAWKLKAPLAHADHTITEYVADR